MADFNPGMNPLFLREEELRRGMETLFLAWRNVTECADDALAAHGLGRAHHRAIYFVGRHPGITVGELLAILKITKQSLSRVLGQLLEDEYIVQETDAEDRRRRRLYLSAKGQDLEHRLTEHQSRLLADAFRDAGAESVEGFRTVLAGIINEDDRKRVL